MSRARCRGCRREQRNQNAAVALQSNVRRAEVRTKAVETRRLDLLNAGERAALVRTESQPAQIAQIHLAGARAVASQLAAK